MNNYNNNNYTGDANTNMNQMYGNNMNPDPNNVGMNVGMAMGMNYDLTMMVQPNQFQPNWTTSNGVTHLNLTAVGSKTQ